MSLRSRVCADKVGCRRGGGKAWPPSARQRRSGLYPVERAVQWPDVPGPDVGLDRGSLHLCMAEPCLAHAAVHPVRPQLGRTPVAQGMAADLLVEPGLLCGSWHRLLPAGFTPVMAPLPGRARVEGARPGREHPLPAGLPHGLWGCPGQRLGEVHGSASRGKVLVMAGVHRRARRRPRGPQVPGQEGGPVRTARGAPDKDAVLAEVHLLDAQAEPLQQAQPAAREPPRPEGVPACDGGEPSLNLRLGAHGGRPWVALTAARGVSRTSR
jgi:hypothetical protein